MRALVTGATGCVGANIVEALLRGGYEVRAMRRKTSRLTALDGLEVELVIGDVLDEASLRQAMEGCDLVFHAAGISQYWRSDPRLIYHVNVEGTRRVLRAAMASGVDRLIYTSSAATLGLPTRPGEMLDEQHPFNIPPDLFPYAHSKHLAEEAVREAVAQGLDAVIVNPVAVIGQRDIGFVGGEILRTVKRGLGLVAPPGGMGVVSAYAVGLGHRLAAERGRTGERYLLNGENLSHRRLMEITAAIVGGRAPLLTLPKAVIPPLAWLAKQVNRLRYDAPLVDETQLRLSACDLRFDASKARRELGFPPHTAEDAVREAWLWYRLHDLL